MSKSIKQAAERAGIIQWWWQNCLFTGTWQKDIRRWALQGAEKTTFGWSRNSIRTGLYPSRYTKL